MGDYGKCYFNNSDEYFLFDTVDLDIVSSYTWRKSNRYASTNVKNDDGTITHTFFHRLVMKKHYGDITEYDVDHKNHNTLDNRLINIRLCTRSNNQLNRKFDRSNTGIRNISYISSTDNYRFSIKYNNISYQKSFNSIDDAISYKNDFLYDHQNEFMYDKFEDVRNSNCDSIPIIKYLNEREHIVPIKYLPCNGAINPIVKLNERL